MIYQQITMLCFFLCMLTTNKNPNANKLSWVINPAIQAMVTDPGKQQKKISLLRIAPFHTYYILISYLCSMLQLAQTTFLIWSHWQISAGDLILSFCQIFANIIISCCQTLSFHSYIIFSLVISIPDICHIVHM